MVFINPTFDNRYVRYLSGPETFMHELTKQSDPYFIYSNIETITSPRALSDADIRKALNRLCNNHGLLRSRVSQDRNGDYFFKIRDQLDDNDVDWVLLRSTYVDRPDDWVSVVNEEFQISFTDDVGPAWRAVVLRPTSIETNAMHRYTFVFTCDHCILDGKGGFDIFGKQFVEILENMFLQQEEKKEIPKPISLFKSYTEIFFNLKGTPSKQYYPSKLIEYILIVFMSFLFWIVRKSGILSVERRKPDFYVYDSYNHDKKHSVISFDFSKELTTSIIKFCKDNSSSVTAFQLVSLSSALKKTAKRFPNCPNNIRNFLYATDLRKFNSYLSESPSGCGLYVDVEPLKLDPIDYQSDVSLFKCESQRVTSDIRKRIVPPTFIKKLMHVGLNQILRVKTLSTEEKLIRIPGLDKPLSFSNIGNCDTTQSNNEHSSGIQLIEHHFTVCSPAPLLINLCTFRQQMRYCICYNGHWIDEHFIKTLVMNFKGIMENIIT